MKKLIISIDKILDLSFPIWVGCSFIDAYGDTHIFNEKLPIVSDCDNLNEQDLPVKGYINCTIGAVSLGGPNAMIVVNTAEPDGIESIRGLSQFTVKYDQVI